VSGTAGKRGTGTPDVAVVAHSRKGFGGGLPELRKVLDAEGVTAPLWHE
jgi:diacylglycerol kinase (ATP)